MDHLVTDRETRLCMYVAVAALILAAASFFVGVVIG
jgi:hypothetical protein